MFALVTGTMFEVRAVAILNVMVDEVEVSALAPDQHIRRAGNPRDDFNGWFCLHGCPCFLDATSLKNEVGNLLYYFFGGLRIFLRKTARIFSGVKIVVIFETKTLGRYYN